MVNRSGYEKSLAHSDVIGNIKQMSTNHCTLK